MISLYQFDSSAEFSAPAEALSCSDAPEDDSDAAVSSVAALIASSAAIPSTLSAYLILYIL